MRFASNSWVITILVVVLSLGLIVGNPAFAQVSNGDFVEYSFSFAGNLRESGDGEGIVRLEVAELNDDGTIRIELSGSLDDLEYSVKKNVEEDSFSFPRLTSPPEIEQSLSRDNGSIAIALERLPDEEFRFQGSDWTLNVSRVSIALTGPNEESLDVDGILRIFSISGILQTFEGSIHSVDQDREATFLVELLDTNLDLEVSPESYITVFSAIDAFSSLGVIDVPLDSNSLVLQGVPSDSNLPPYSLILALVLGIILISFVSIRARKSNSDDGEDYVKPLHWVN